MGRSRIKDVADMNAEDTIERIIAAAILLFLCENARPPTPSIQLGIDAANTAIDEDTTERLSHKRKRTDAGEESEAPSDNKSDVDPDRETNLEELRMLLHDTWDERDRTCGKGGSVVSSGNEGESDDEAAEDEGILLLTEKQTVQYWFKAAFPESKSQYSDNNIDHLNGILRLEKVQSHPADTPLGALRENLQAKRRALLDGRSHLPPLAVTYSECLQMNTPRL
jgi:hypothetical protein